MTKKLTQDIILNNDYVSKLTLSLDDMEKHNSKLSSDFEQYKVSIEKTLSVLTNKLDASEEIVKQIFPGK